MPGTAGNLSVRLPDGRAVITGSGRDKGALTRQDMALVDAGTGEQLSGGTPRASAETSIHAAVYRTTQARAVIRTALIPRRSLAVPSLRQAGGFRDEGRARRES